MYLHFTFTIYYFLWGVMFSLFPSYVVLRSRRRKRLMNSFYTALPWPYFSVSLFHLADDISVTHAFFL
jgi:hypothetical protein